MTQNAPYTIAVDAMGGDDAPATPVAGAVLAAREGNVRVLLVGDPEAVGRELAAGDAGGLAIEVVGSDGVVGEGEHPALALRRNPKVSIAVAVGLVKAGKADAVVSMGSTGATMAASVLALGLFPGLERPTLGGPFIGLAPNTAIIDLGANIDCRPSQLVGFAAMGATLMKAYRGIENPRVALLSVGSEDGKGNRQVQETHKLLEASGLNFVGNVEGHEIFEDKANVVVCDGFVGNVLLKFTEGLAVAAAAHLARALGADSPAVAQIKGIADQALRGGGPLLGVNGIAIAGHGRTSAAGVAAGIALAEKALAWDLVRIMRDDLAAVLERAEAAPEGPGG
ncbi:MAG: phosphate acyltransferase PlsX [Chloroflexi bacterium]|nr:phosphate acyltransferase PlsX [Chloroflexota bacterium]